jgi:virginiamycin B lyase
MVAGPDGNLWFTDVGGHKIGRITPSGIISTFLWFDPAAEPIGIAVGPAGNLWFSDGGAFYIGRMVTWLAILGAG